MSIKNIAVSKTKLELTLKEFTWHSLFIAMDCNHYSILSQRLLKFNDGRIFLFTNFPSSFLRTCSFGPNLPSRLRKHWPNSDKRPANLESFPEKLWPRNRETVRVSLFEGCLLADLPHMSRRTLSPEGSSSLRPCFVLLHYFPSGQITPFRIMKMLLRGTQGSFDPKRVSMATGRICNFNFFSFFFNCILLRRTNASKFGKMDASPVSKKMCHRSPA